jgi:hypothetical protein
MGLIPFALRNTVERSLASIADLNFFYIFTVYRSSMLCISFVPIFPNKNFFKYKNYYELKVGIHGPVDVTVHRGKHYFCIPGDTVDLT